MKHFTSTHHFGSDIRQFIGSFHFDNLLRSGHGQHELNAHLRHDIGDDDVRPAVEPATSATTGCFKPTHSTP